jgi:uncharacterized protein
MSAELKVKLEKYLTKARPRFEELVEEKPSSIDLEKVREEFRTMALTYYSDAKHFYASGDYLNALAALEYAEGWLDAGRALGIFKNK